MASEIDYYEQLNVSRDCDGATLKSSYRKLAMQWHPDKNPGDAEAEARFKTISEAYDVLKDPQKRAAYDRYGHAAFTNGGGNNAGGGGFGGAAFNDIGDIFETIFGGGAGGGFGGQQQRGPARGADLRYDMEITLEDAYHGKHTEIEIDVSVACDECDGSGAEPGTGVQRCGTCHGQGKVRAQQGFFTIERTCPSCQGQGKVIKDPCPSCRGTGRQRKDKTLEVRIPAGVEDGTRIRLSGEGEAGLRGGQAGDLYIFLNLKPHRMFQRDGANIFCKVPIPMTTAALGGTVEVPAIDGSRARVTIPKGTQTGHQFRLKDKGMSVLRSTARGDMYIQATVETPSNLSKKQEDLLREFEEAGKGHEEKQSPESTSFFKRVKELWEDLTE